MNNLTWSGDSAKKKQDVKEESKTKKKIDYKKDLTDLEKILERIKEKYGIKPTNPISSAMVNLDGAIEGVKREIENITYMDARKDNNGE
jgi:thiamine pyrophosphokinase